MKAIYEIRIGDNYYIGKDSKYPNRKVTHIRELGRNTHYNNFMQHAYNKHCEFECRPIIIFSESFPDLQMYEVEAKVIKSYKERGLSLMNLTDGGIGGTGHKKTENWTNMMTDRMTGERNPMSKISEEDVFKIYDMIDDGKTNREIAKVFDIHQNYVSLLRHGKRHKALYKMRYGNKVLDESIGRIKSHGRNNVSYESFLKIMSMIEEGFNYVQISKEVDHDRSVINRIAQRKTYLKYWEKYESN